MKYYENGEKTAAQLLKSMSRLNGPSRAELLYDMHSFHMFT